MDIIKSEVLIRSSLDALYPNEPARLKLLSLPQAANLYLIRMVQAPPFGLPQYAEKLCTLPWIDALPAWCAICAVMRDNEQFRGGEVDAKAFRLALAEKCTVNFCVNISDNHAHAAWHFARDLGVELPWTSPPKEGFYAAIKSQLKKMTNRKVHARHDR